jgi:hypothetical protein
VFDTVRSKLLVLKIRSKFKEIKQTTQTGESWRKTSDNLKSDAKMLRSITAESVR